jgi:hypothetical protein
MWISLSLFFAWLAWNAWTREEYFRSAITGSLTLVYLLRPWFDHRPRPLSDSDLVEHLTSAERKRFDELTGRPALIGLIAFMGLLIAGQVAEELIGRPWFHILFVVGAAVLLIVAYFVSKRVQQFLRSTEYARDHTVDSAHRGA